MRFYARTRTLYFRASFFYVQKRKGRANMHKHTQSALIKQAATMATLAIETTANVDMTKTLRDLKGYQTSLTLVKDAELKPFGQQAKTFVTSTIKYLQNRTQQNLETAHKQRDKLSEMMPAHMGRE